MKSVIESVALADIEESCSYHTTMYKEIGINNGSPRVAVKAGTIVSLVPTPLDTTCKSGYIHSIYTLPPYRKKGFATDLLTNIIDVSRKTGIGRLVLNASSTGMQIYNKLGFTQVAEHMRLCL